MRIAEGPVPRERAWRVAAILAALVALAGIGPRARPQTPPPGAGIFAEGHLAENYAKKGDSIRFWISIENRSTATINEIRLAKYYAPGFALVPWCLPATATCGPVPDSTPRCVSPPPANPLTPPDEKLICLSLAAGEAISVQGEFVAKEPKDEHNVYVELTWTMPLASDPRAPAALSSRVVPLGQGEAVSETLYLFRKLLSQPQYALALLAAILTVLGGWLTKRLEQRAMTWSTTMLVEAHKAAVQYYMPTGSWLSAAVSALRQCNPGVSAPPGTKRSLAEVESLHLAYFYLVMFQWGYLQTFINESAFHLKDRMGEHLVQMLYGRHKALVGLHHEPVKRMLDRILGRLRKDMTLDEFLDLMNLAPRGDLGRGWRLFQKWVCREDCKIDIQVLECFLGVLIYEVNRPNLFWYGRHDALQFSKVQEKLLFNLGPGSVDPSGQRKWRAKVEEYLVRARRVTRSGWLASTIQKAWYWFWRPWRAARRTITTA